MSSYPGPEALYDHELFAVINNKGQIDYNKFCAFSGQSTYNSAFASRTLAKKASKSESGGVSQVYWEPTSAPIYMVFYIKWRLDYKLYIMPSYVLTWESEAVREREVLAVKACAEQVQVQVQARE
ncbi:hypothetical protein B0F90DRAFT_1825008 [Multifurca ochricompacta]|uniref:Uncharacterized protein n=1 Tax=Multifurca ochricompacta TaxID=376703 RepID=A0AAD4QIW9_9AGAM|nr:hypothetical protein B0F90DRAFT_1825008 [Multifurca ochricompacta]